MYSPSKNFFTMSRYSLIFSLLLSSTILNSCGGGSSAATSGTSSSVTTTYELTNLDASSYKNCEYYGYYTNGSNCSAVPGSGVTSSAYSVSSFSHTNDTLTVFSGYDFIRLAEARAILAAGDDSVSEGMTYDGSYSYIDSNGTTQSGSVNIAIIGSGVGISDDAISSSSSQIDTTGYRDSSTAEFANFVADRSATGAATSLIDGLTGNNADDYAFVSDSSTTTSPYKASSPTSQLTSANDYVKNVDPEDGLGSSYTEIGVYSSTSGGRYDFYSTSTTNYGLDDFIGDCESTDCKATLSAYQIAINPKAGSNDSVVESRSKTHDVDYFIFEDNDSANGTALAAIISGPNGTSSSGSTTSGTFSSGMATGTTINSYKTMFDYGKYFAYYTITEDSANSSSTDLIYNIENQQYFGSYTSDTSGSLTYFDYDDDTVINGNDTTQSDLNGDGQVQSYNYLSVDTTIPEMFLYQDGNGYQTYQAMLQAIVTDGNEVILLNDQFRNYYYAESDTSPDSGGTSYERTDELNIYSYSSLAGFRTVSDTNYTEGSDPDVYIVEKDFATVSDVDTVTDGDATGYYDDILSTMKAYSADGTNSDETRAFVIPADPSMLKMAVMTDSDLNTASSANSNTDIDDTKIASAYSNYMFVAGVNVDYYTVQTSNNYTENFSSGLDEIDEIILSIDSDGTYLSNDYSTIDASDSLISSGSSDLFAAIDSYAGTSYGEWDCSGLLNCMVAPGNVYSYTKYNQYTSYDEMDDNDIPFLDGSSTSNSLSDGYYVTETPDGYEDGVRETENLATAYVTGAISMILGAYYEEYNEGTLTIDDIVTKMLTYATPASQIAGCSAYSGDVSVTPGTEIDCGVGMLNVQRTLEAACNDDDFDPDGECSVTVNAQGETASLSLSSLTLGPSFGNSLNSQQASNILKQAVYYDNYNFRYSANLDTKIHANQTNYLLKNYLNAGNSTREFERYAPTASFSLDMSYDKYNQVFEDGSTTRYFNGPVDPDKQQNLAFSNYSFNTKLGNNTSFNFTMEGTTLNDLSPSYMEELTSALSFTDANSYIALTGNSANFSEIGYKFNKHVGVSFGYATEAETSLSEGSSLMFNNLKLSYKTTDVTFSFGSLIESDSMLETEGSSAFSFQDDVNTKYYGVSLRQSLSGKLSLIASYNFGETDVEANGASVFQNFSRVRSEETTIGLVHHDQGTKIGFLYKEPMRVTEGDVFIQVATKKNANGSYSFTSGWASLSPDGKERDFEIFMEKQLDHNNTVKLNLLKRVEPYHISSNKDEDMVLMSLTKKF